MRTTLTLEDDLAGRLHERARQLGISFKEMVNRAIRAGLGPDSLEDAKPPITRPHSFGFRSDIDLDRMNELADDLENEAILASMSSGRS